MTDVLGLLVFLGSGLSLLMAVAGLARKGPGRPPVLWSALVGLVGVLLLEFFLTHTLGLEADMATRPVQTELFLLVRCVKYSLGPLFLAFFVRLTTYQALQGRRLLTHFVPQALVFILSIAYMASSLTGSAAFAPLRKIMGVATDLGLLHLVTYLVASLVVARTSGNTGLTRVVTIVSTVAACILAMLALYAVTGLKPLEVGSQAVLASAMIGLFLFVEIRPGGLDSFGRQARGRTYQRSLLAGADTELLVVRLEDLMVNEKVFLDEELTLESLARSLSISRNRLSELLNGVLDSSFSAYVNRHRVEEVIRLLDEHPERSVLSHAYAAGFNSKSVFYEAFRRVTGMAPQEYRDRMRIGRHGAGSAAPRADEPTSSPPLAPR